MARKKKITEPIVTEAKIEEKIINTETIVNTKETYLFQITPVTENAKLYKYPTDKNSQGKLKRGEVCNVICEVCYTSIKMYKLDTGYYVAADQNIKII